VAVNCRRNGSKVRLQEQPFQILTMLLENPGEIVTREELRNRLWPADTFVDFEPWAERGRQTASRRAWGLGGKSSLRGELWLAGLSVRGFPSQRSRT